VTELAEVNFCQRCGEKLTWGTEVWMELDNTTGKYLSSGEELPAGHVSQGWFPFGGACAQHPNAPSKKR
jgi:hypothetical protein